MLLGDLAECYEKHSAALLRFAATQVGPNDAADVVSAAMVGVLRQDLGRIDDLTAYLYRAVANRSVSHWRSLTRRQRREAWAWREDDGVAGLGGRSGTGAGSNDGADDVALPDARVLAALALLTPPQRAAIHLTYWEDLPTEEIARRMGIADGTVRSQLARARARLRGVLGDEH